MMDGYLRGGVARRATGLACAFFGGLLLATCAPSGPTLDDDGAALRPDPQTERVVARVNGTTISLTDVRRAAESQGLIGADETLLPDSPIFETALGELIDQRILSLDAIESGVAQDAEVRRRLSAARERILGNYRVEAYLSQTVTDAAVQDLYLAQSELAGQGEERFLRQIVAQSEADAQAALRRLDDEEDFAGVAFELSVDEPTLARDGDLGWVGRGGLDAALSEPVFETVVGSRIGPVELDGLFYVIEVVDARVPSARSFEDTREEIERFMTFEAVQSLVTRLREEADIDRVALPEETPIIQEPAIQEPDTQEEDAQ
jgi:peptidyl-prolyl cis-trans isomerase C